MGARVGTVLAASFLFTISVFTVSILPAEDFFITYLEGDVAYKIHDTWADGAIGDSIPSGTEVRIGSDGFLEVVYGSRTMRYGEEGSYQLGSVQASQEVGSTDLGGLIRGTVNRFTRPTKDTAERSVAAGVRASEAAQAPTIDWAGDESPEELLEEGIAALNLGEIEDASYLFEDAFLFADGPIRDRSGFFYVYSLYLLDEQDRALATLDEFTPNPSAEYFPEYAMLAGEIYLTSERRDAAITLLQRALEYHETIERRDPLSAQGIYYLLGLAVAGDNPERARRYFARAAEIAPSTAVGIEAASR